MRSDANCALCIAPVPSPAFGLQSLTRQQRAWSDVIMITDDQAHSSQYDFVAIKLSSCRSSPSIINSLSNPRLVYPRIDPRDNRRFREFPYVAFVRLHGSGSSTN